MKGFMFVTGLIMGFGGVVWFLAMPSVEAAVAGVLGLLIAGNAAEYIWGEGRDEG